MPQIQDRTPTNAPTLQLVPRAARASSASDSAREMLESVRAQLLNIERKLEADIAAQPRHRVGPSEILTCLKQNRHMTAPEILKALPGLAKSSLWLHLNALEREGKVWFRLTYAGGKRKVTEIWHGEEIAT